MTIVFSSVKAKRRKREIASPGFISKHNTVTNIPRNHLINKPFLKGYTYEEPLKRPCV